MKEKKEEINQNSIKIQSNLCKNISKNDKNVLNRERKVIEKFS